MKKILLLAILLMFAVNLNAQSFVPKTEIVIRDSGETLSNPLDLGGYKVFQIEIPSTFNGDSIIIYDSKDTTSANFKPCYDLETDTILKYKITAGRKYRFIPSDQYYFERYIKIWGNSAAATTPDTLSVIKGSY